MALEVSAYLIGGIVLTLSVLIILVLLYIRQKQQKMVLDTSLQQNVQKGVPSFKRLWAIVDADDTQPATLRQALDNMVKYYGVITVEQGELAEESFQSYAKIITALCRHQHADAKMIVRFESALCRQNSRYAAEIEVCFQRALSRS